MLGAGPAGWVSTSIRGAGESNHVPERADHVDPETTVEGALTEGEADRYTIDLEAAQTVGVVFDSTFADWDEKRAEISVCDPDGSVLDSTEVAEPYRTAIGATVAASGTYVVTVASLDGAFPYSVLLKVAADSNEPNDDRESATTLSSGSPCDGAVIGDDADWFVFDAAAGDGIELDLTAHTLARNRDIEMALFDPDGTKIGETPRDRPFGVYSTRSDLQFNGPVDEAIGADVAEQDGPFYVRVGGVNGAVRGFTAYTLTVETVDLDAYDPNERRETATPLNRCEPIEAVITGYDHDWYTFDATAGDELTIDYQITEFADLFDPVMAVYDPNNERIKVGRARPIEVSADIAGTYSLHIAQSDNTGPKAFLNKEAYTLSLR